MKDGKQTTYEDLIKHNPALADVIDEESFNYVRKTGTKTVERFKPIWAKNLKENAERFKFPDHLLTRSCGGFGANKATVMIGAGPSLNHNWDYLKKINVWNWQFPFEEQPFLFVVSNHQFKPCLKDGIIPHFVLLADSSGSKPIYDQLCRKVPRKAKHITLIASLNVDPKIPKDWAESGREVQFYIPDGESHQEAIKKVTGDDFKREAIIQGGNVMNLAWTISIQAFHSRVFISLGNDLSYDLADTKEERRKNYYQDGDYSSNLASKRDEAGKVKKWIGFKMYRCPFTRQPSLKFVPKGTTGTLFTYKKWLETYIGIQDVIQTSFHYYNCSEEGILGVVPKSIKAIDLEDVNNWRLLDEILPRRYHTRMFEETVTDILTARELCRIQEVTNFGARPVIVLPESMGGARSTGPSRIKSL